MRCIIIEDESYAALYLEKQLRECLPDIEIQARIDTVEDSVNWLGQHSTDLIFMDIQLGDGLSFEIFDHVQISTPIIFTTSYDRYAIKAFDQNSIAYLLKPIKKSDLMKAIDKYGALYTPGTDLNRSLAKLHKGFQDKFIVQSGNVMQTLRAGDIAYFLLQNKRYLFLTTKENRQFMYDSSLEFLESRLNPEQFFRINRQYIINKDIVSRAEYLDRGRMLLHTRPESKESLVVSIGRAKDFKEWLSS